MPLETHRMLALSTRHLTQETDTILERCKEWGSTSLPIYYPKGEYGWFVHVPELPIAMPPDCPTDLEACLHLAISQRFQWIMFDCDVGPTEHLPVFKW